MENLDSSHYKGLKIKAAQFRRPITIVFMLIILYLMWKDSLQVRL